MTCRRPLRRLRLLHSAAPVGPARFPLEQTMSHNLSDTSLTLSPADRQHCLEALDRLIAARNQVLGLLIERVNDGNNGNNVVLDNAVGEVKRVAHKLGRYHPDAEYLPLMEWSEIRELGILSDHQRRKRAYMSTEEVNEWKSGVIRAMKDHTAKIVSELEQEQATLRASRRLKRCRSPSRTRRTCRSSKRCLRPQRRCPNARLKPQP